MTRPQFVVFGASNMVSDLFDCAHAAGLVPTKVVLHHEEAAGPRDVGLRDRVAAFARLGVPPRVLRLDEFEPEKGESYLLGPTTPARAELASLLVERFGIRFCTLVHPTAYVSPLADLGAGTFVGARSVIAAGAVLDEHVFVNRGVTVGHDTRIGAFTRLQPGANVASLCDIGAGVTIGIGSTLVERLHVGDHCVVAAGAVLTHDVPSSTLAGGAPARFRSLERAAAADRVDEWLEFRRRRRAEGAWPGGGSPP